MEGDDKQTDEDTEESEPVESMVKFDLNLDRDLEPDWDDEDHWKSHRRRFVRRELNLQYSKLCIDEGVLTAAG